MAALNSGDKAHFDSIVSDKTIHFVGPNAFNASPPGHTFIYEHYSHTVWILCAKIQKKTYVTNFLPQKDFFFFIFFGFIIKYPINYLEISPIINNFAETKQSA